MLTDWDFPKGLLRRSLDGGGLLHTIKRTYGHYPFGATWYETDTLGDRHKFAGMDRAAETDLDHTRFREDSTRLMRWFSPDPENAGADESDPQSWNAYAYVGNNPVNATDPSGERKLVCQSGENGNTEKCVGFSDEAYNKWVRENAGTFRIVRDEICAKAGGARIGVVQDLGPDLPTSTVQILARVVEMAGPTVQFFHDLTMGFVSTVGPGTLAAAGPAVEASIGRAMVSASTKAAARDAIQGISMSPLQRAAVGRAISRATTTEKVSIDRLADGSIRVLRTRPGFQGSQTFSIIVDTAGNTRRAQVAVDSAGRIVHYDPK